MEHRTSGFTLVEAATTVAIVALAISIGLPSFEGLLDRQRVATAVHLLSADMALARSAAIMRRQQVVLCPGDASGCRPGGDWGGGWVVFADADRDREPDSTADLLSVGQAHRDIAMPSTRAYLRYQLDGRSAGTNLTVNVCMAGQLHARVIANNTGRVRTERLDASTPCPG